MKLTTYGSRGSIPCPTTVKRYGEIFSTEEFGGNTTSFLIEADDGKLHIIDAGTGIRQLGLDLGLQGVQAQLYISHTHWDHIQGFPFFAPLYNPGFTIDVYGEAKITGDLVDAIKKSGELTPQHYLRVLNVNDDGIKKVLEDQQRARNFPAPLSAMKGLGKFYDFLPGGKIYEDDATLVETQLVNHPGGCVSYKFIGKQSGDVVVINSDFEPDQQSLDAELLNWWKDSNIVVADAQYEKDSAVNPVMKGWGHSDYQSDIDLAFRGGVANLLLTHHEPKMDDTYHRELEQKAINYAEAKPIDFLKVRLAREGEMYIVKKGLEPVYENQSRVELDGLSNEDPHSDVSKVV